MGAVDLRRRELRCERHGHAVGVGADLLERIRDQQVDGPQLGPATGRPRVEPRKVEQVLDEALEPPHLTPDRLQQPLAVCFRERDLVARETVARRSDRGERRAKVVAHGLQDRRLHGVALAKHLGLDRLVRQPPRPRRQLADDHRCREVHGKRDPVRRVGQRQCVDRRQEEVVEREHRRDRDGDRVRQASLDRYDDDCDHVEHAQAQNGCDRAESEDHSGHSCDGRDAEEHTASPVGVRAPLLWDRHFSYRRYRRLAL